MFDFDGEALVVEVSTTDDFTRAIDALVYHADEVMAEAKRIAL